MRVHYVPFVLALAMAVPAAAQQPQLPGPPAQQPSLRKPDIFYLPTPQPVVEAMLKMANVTGTDVIYDLGSGDGRIPITAAKLYGARGIGIDIDPKRVEEANANAKAAGVTDKVRFMNADIYEQSFSDATVITLYLLPDLNLKLMPQLKKLKPGTRIVSHAFRMGSSGEAWPHDKTEDITYTDESGSKRTSTIYYWVVK